MPYLKMSDVYDENLLDNNFFKYLKLEHRDVFEEAISNQYVICAPKSVNNDGESATLEMVLDHILIPSTQNSETSSQDYTTMKGEELVIYDGSIMRKDERDRSVTILFEETFYERKLGRYKVVCINNSITNILKDDNSYCSVQQGEIAPCNILENLQTATDFSKHICQLSKNPSALDEIDSCLIEFCSVSLVSTDAHKAEQLRNKVYYLFKECMDNFVSSKDLLSDHELKCLGISMESYITHKLHYILFQVSTRNMAADDDTLNRMLQGASNINVSDFDDTISNLNWLHDAKCELAAINRYKSPFGKLQCIKKAIDRFQTCTGALSSDKLLSTLVFCIVKCKVNNWFANLYFIKTFSFYMETSNSEYNFIVSSFEAALVFLCSGQRNGQSLKEITTDFLLENCNLKSNEFGKLTTESNNSKLSLLHKYIIKGDLKEVREILEHQNFKETFSSTRFEHLLCHPLCICNKCKQILNDNTVSNVSCNTDFCDENGMTPLHIAAWHGCLNIAEYLLSEQIFNCNAKNVSGMTPLHLAGYRGHQTTLLLLLHFGCDINIVDNDGNNALHLACSAGHDSCVKALIFFAESAGKPLSFNTQNVNGDTPLHIAACLGYVNIVKILLNQNCISSGGLSIKNKRNQTPITCAQNALVASVFDDCATENCGQTNLLLLQLDTQTTSKSKNTNQNYVQENSYKENITILRKTLNAIHVGDTKLACFYLEIDTTPNCLPSSNANIEMEYVCHPLCQCSKCASISVATTPVKCNLDLINMIGEENYGVLHVAVLTENIELCRLLLENGANPQVITRNEKQSSLHLAVLRENSEIMKLLIMFNANVNCADLFGNTPLHLSCRGWKDGVLLLIESGARLNTNNKEDSSPKEEAEKNGQIEIVEILIRKMCI